MENAIFWDIETQFLLYKETYYISATEHSLLMLRKIWGFHGGENEECRLLECKCPYTNSKETHKVSARKPNWLMLCKVWDFQGGDYEECRLLWHRVAFVRTDVSEERIAFIIKVKNQRARNNGSS
jgi:hypothetical protein